MSVALSPADIERHHRLGIPESLLDLARVHRVTDLPTITVEHAAALVERLSLALVARVKARS